METVFRKPALRPVSNFPSRIFKTFFNKYKLHIFK
ncbi:MAG: hypothetical protein RLZZ112_43 [Verrucomicrobiota bacterium]